ncbi:MAG TPA: hypothetical protein VL463_11240 [Kofleriaceae bacterium]|jgi:hypothetical protein|nr:hypothetical protein [Kofleriaceae bacterium]
MRKYRSRTWVLGLATLVAGCATAKPNTTGEHADARPDGEVIGGRPDAMEPPDAPPHIDAPPGTPDARPPDAMIAQPDAMPGVVTMTQTNANNIVVGNSVSCNDGSPFFDTSENSYYRAFKLSDYGVTGTFHLQKVDFGVETAARGGASQSVTVKVYTYTGAYGGTTLDTTAMTLVTSGTVTVPDTTTGETLTANLSANIPATATIVVEIFVPDGTAAGNEFFLGSNTGGESKPGYIRAPDCSTTTPTAFSTLGVGEVDVLITATGTYN